MGRYPDGHHLAYLGGKYLIREATRADIPDIVDLGERHLRSGAYAGLIEPNRAAMSELARMLIEVDHGLLLIDERGGMLTGTIGMLATLHPYSGKPVMSEMFWYTIPEARGAGVRLLKAAEAWGRANGIKHAIVVAPEARVAAFYPRLGYRPLEWQFIKEL